MLLLAALCISCGKDGGIQDTFFGSVEFGQQKHQVLEALYAQHFVDAATGQQDQHFDTIPLDDGDYSELKILASADSTGFAFLGQRWLNVQVQFDGNGLYCISFRAKATAKAKASKEFAAILRTLQKNYEMQRMVIGNSSAEGQAADIVGYRYDSGLLMVQLYLNELPDGSAAPVLSYIATKEYSHRASRRARRSQQ